MHQYNIKKQNTVGATFKVTAGNDRATATIPYEDKIEGWMGRCPELYSEHPLYTGLALIDVEQKETEGGMCLVTLNYESWTGQYGTGETRRYELSVTTSEEHILTHPRYDSLSDAERKALLNISNGTESDENGSLYESQVSSSQGQEALEKIRKGVTHFLVPGVIWTERYTSQNLGSVDLSDCGKIDNPPGGPPTASGRNWLYIGATSQQTADGRFFNVEKQWRLSGRSGWDHELYDA